MELVIKVPNELYNNIRLMSKNRRGIALQCIADGTPLPKGHGKIIDESRITEVYMCQTEPERIHGMLLPPSIKIVGTDAPTIIEADNGQKARDDE